MWHDDRVSPPSRAEHRSDVTSRVLAVGRRHLAQHGAAALSLRAVARDLGMVSSAVYRYVANRDELLTLLVVDAYSEQADAVDDAVASAAGADWADRVAAAARAFRAWAVAEPARYALVYGSPVPGYAAPPERTIEPGTRVIGTVLGLIAEGVARGEVTDGPAAAQPEPPEPLATDLRRLGAEVGMPAHPAVLARATLLWACLVGATSLEVFGQYGQDAVTDAEQLFDQQVAMALAVLRGRNADGNP